VISSSINQPIQLNHTSAIEAGVAHDSLPIADAPIFEELSILAFSVPVRQGDHERHFAELFGPNTVDSTKGADNTWGIYARSSHPRKRIHRAREKQSQASPANFAFGAIQQFCLLEKSQSAALR